MCEMVSSGGLLIHSTDEILKRKGRPNPYLDQLRVESVKMGGLIAHLVLLRTLPPNAVLFYPGRAGVGR